MKFLDLDGLTHFKNTIMSYIVNKIDVNQGSENVNKVLSINSSGNVVTSDFHIPPITNDDEGKIIQVVGGDLSFVTMNIKTIYSGSTEPSSDVGDDGDVYLQT